MSEQINIFGEEKTFWDQVKNNTDIDNIQMDDKIIISFSGKQIYEFLEIFKVPRKLIYQWEEIKNVVS